jgi:hypothetical protein
LSRAITGGDEKPAGAVKPAPGGVKKTAVENFRKAAGQPVKEAAKVEETANIEPEKAEPQPKAEAPQTPAEEPGEGKTGGDSAGGIGA